MLEWQRAQYQDDIIHEDGSVTHRLRFECWRVSFLSLLRHNRLRVQRSLGAVQCSELASGQLGSGTLPIVLQPSSYFRIVILQSRPSTLYKAASLGCEAQHYVPGLVVLGDNLQGSVHIHSLAPISPTIGAIAACRAAVARRSPALGFRPCTRACATISRI